MLFMREQMKEDIVKAIGNSVVAKGEAWGKAPLTEVCSSTTRARSLQQLQMHLI